MTSASAKLSATAVTKCPVTARLWTLKPCRICSRICTRYNTRLKGAAMRKYFSSWDNLPVKNAALSDLYRKLPSVNEVIAAAALSSLAASYGRDSTVDAVRVVLARLREEITSGLLEENALDLALSGLASAVEKQLRQSLSYSLRPVINATGVILHTNLGRAPLGDAALEHIRETAASYSNLEFDLESGERGKRDVHVDRLFRKRLSSDVGGAESATSAAALRAGGTAEAAVSTPATLSAPAQVSMPAVSTIVVNNNAAAVLLALNTLADGG